MAVIPIPEVDWSGESIVPLRLPSPSVEMCTRIRFLGWAPGSRVPSQAPTIGGSPAAIMGSGMIANPGISVNPNQSPNDNARYLFMVDLLIELQLKSARSQSGITLFRGLSPAIAIEGRVPAARPHHANSARISLYGILATTSRS